jgi:hypothetical protein
VPSSVCVVLYARHSALSSVGALLEENTVPQFIKTVFGLNVYLRETAVFLNLYLNHDNQYVIHSLTRLLFKVDSREENPVELILRVRYM